MPSENILDEKELYQKLITTSLDDPNRCELQEAFYYFWAINHEDTSMKTKLNFGSTFVDENDQKQTIEKYFKNHFY